MLQPVKEGVELISYDPEDYLKISSREEIRKCRDQRVRIVRKISIEERFRCTVTTEAERAYMLLKHFEGSYCLLDGYVPALLQRVERPPVWSQFFCPPETWEYSYIGSWWNIYLIKNTR